MASILNGIPTTQSYFIQALPRQKSSFQSIKQKILTKVMQNEKQSTLHKILQNYKKQAQQYVTPAKKPTEPIGKTKTTKKEKKQQSVDPLPRTASNQNRKFSQVSTITIKITSFDSDSEIVSTVEKEPKVYEVQLDQFD
ncbi:unnamed protein product (macronuclear) [Paramecium tetraurelia]|uniref:Uncharacterized protein n=1 Tax=Paramecium tetraurelia TaxID=5888 RepID=A0C0T0_PARTE|nr:uncharacterized protein GSPATT00033873001 [Paramecium tetraurelia]CAK64397.1 unnamed protein product [Paramecium tetraurelia]|eukprot:XP_001431795.1 hypothetical protein (macronuclear) [Paramecium tetraurelia strain d4-2]